MTQPKRLITLNARTDKIAEQIKRRNKYGFSAWVRHRLTAWDRKQQDGYPEEPEVEILRLERLLAERHAVAWKLATQLSIGSRAFVDMREDQIVGSTLWDIRQAQTSEEVVY
jgi:hypothetical protein